MKTSCLLAILVLGVVIIATAAIPVQPTHDEIPVGAEEYDVGAEEEFVEEPTTTTTARPSRRRSGGRAKANAAKAAAAAAAAATDPDSRAAAPAPPAAPATEKPAKRPRTTTAAPASSRTTTKSPADEPVTSTYKRPKFPPRRLPVPKPSTPAPVEEITDGLTHVDEGLPPAEGDLEGAPVGEEIIE